MPSPLGEGQVNTPIITLIWVRSQTPLPSPLKGRSQCLLKQIIDLEIHHPITQKRIRHHTLSLGRGTNGYADQSS